LDAGQISGRVAAPRIEFPAAAYQVRKPRAARQPTFADDPNDEALPDIVGEFIDWGKNFAHWLDEESLSTS